MNEARLKTLIEAGKLSLFYIHGTARSGSTIAEVVFSRLTDQAIHQPFAGLRHKLGGHNRPNKQPVDDDIYQAGCGVITEVADKLLQEKDHVSLLVKEVSRFFHPEIWKKWIQLPDKFLFFVREPHLQYLSWLSYVADLKFQSDGALMSQPKQVLATASEIENISLPLLRPAWSGTTMSYNLQEWQALVSDFNVLREFIAQHDNQKRLAVLDLITLRQNPQQALSKTLAQLDIEVENVAEFDRNLLAHSKEKIFDVRDSNRAQVKKARNSNEINRLKPGEAVATSAFPSESQAHILKLIPLYLELLYAPEHVALPTVELLQQPVTGSENLYLAHSQPFVAYAIAKFHHHQHPDAATSALLEDVLSSETETITMKASNQFLFKTAFEEVSQYWQQ